MVARLDHTCATNSEAAAMDGSTTVCLGEDPALDQFMEAYCEMLTKYEQELTKPIKEAMFFLSSIQSQLKALTVSSSSDSGDELINLLNMLKFFNFLNHILFMFKTSFYGESEVPSYKYNL